MSNTTSTIETTIDTPSTDMPIATPESPTSKRKRTKVGKGSTPTVNAAQRARSHASKLAVLWSKRYTAIAVGLSSALNAYSGVSHSNVGGFAGMMASGAIGAVIPLLVWMLGSVTAWTYRAGWTRLAYVTGAIACCVLALSVVHVAGALATLTGSGIVMAGLLAVGIDCGLVASEATAVLVSMVE
jgi:hypothetical protein